ncbi:MAG TPA: preprotein translocase subunit SecY [Polyangiaceae bacterium]|jgi:preprotein translocase subunit SecY|nr:preprotein translocase subunit SecY [Polyangiaceae bacterium]
MAVVGGFSNITKVPELRRRIGFTLLIVAIYRVGVFITTPGVDRSVMRAVVRGQAGLLGLFNLFSGGAVANLSLFALGIMPYVSASIIMQLLGLVSKQVEELRKEGETGRRKLEQWTRYGAVALSIFQSFGVAMWLEGLNEQDVGGGRFADVVGNPGWSFRILTILTLTTGHALLMWMGEQATDRGIGNGTSMIILASIVSGIPGGVANYWSANAGDVQPLTIFLLLAILLGCVAIVVFFERAQRQIPIQYARRQVGRRVYGGQTAHLPLKVNMASMIPPIFASSLLMFPATLANFNLPGMSSFSAILNRGDWAFNVIFAILIIFFAFFYTSVTFNPVDVADNLKKQQANIPGIRPGRHTAEYIDRVVTRITVGGSIYLAAICIIPAIVSQIFHVPFQFGGTSLIIVVGVALETTNQIEAHLITRSYEGLTGPQTTRLSGRRPA